MIGLGSDKNRKVAKSTWRVSNVVLVNFDFLFFVWSRPHCSSSKKEDGWNDMRDQGRPVKHSYLDWHWAEGMNIKDQTLSDTSLLCNSGHHQRQEFNTHWWCRDVTKCEIAMIGLSPPKFAWKHCHTTGIIDETFFLLELSFRKKEQYIFFWQHHQRRES